MTPIQAHLAAAVLERREAELIDAIATADDMDRYVELLAELAAVQETLRQELRRVRN